LLSRTAQYALRAMTYLARQPAERRVGVREIARRTGVPAQYLARILRDAVRAKLLESARGVGGGFCLARPAKRIRLREVLAPFDDVVARCACPFGQASCGDGDACGIHPHWKPVKRAYLRMLERTTLAEVAVIGLPERCLVVGR